MAATRAELCRVLPRDLAILAESYIWPASNTLKATFKAGHYELAIAWAQGSPWLCMYRSCRYAWHEMIDYMIAHNGNLSSGAYGASKSGHDDIAADLIARGGIVSADDRVYIAKWQARRQSSKHSGQI